MRKRISEILLKRKYFLLLLALSPVIWWLISQPITVAREVTGFPNYASNRFSTIFSEEKLRQIDEMRWNAFSDKKEEYLSQAYYNKALLLVDNLFEYLSLLSPRIYFQAGEGSALSPPGVEPIPFFAFFFWIYGLFELVKQKTYKPIYLLLAFPCIAFVAGSRSFAFLLPVIVLNIFIASIGLEKFVHKNKSRKLLVSLMVAYGLYIVGRALWLTG